MYCMLAYTLYSLIQSAAAFASLVMETSFFLKSKQVGLFNLSYGLYMSQL